MLEDQFCERLTQLRLQKGVSARDMSLSLGQSESYINRIESKKMLPSMSVFFYICEYFGISPKEFFDFIFHTTPPNSNIYILSQYFYLCNIFIDFMRFLLYNSFVATKCCM